MNFKLPAFLLSAAALSGCVDIPDFDNAPKIYYNGVSQYTEVDTLNPGTGAEVIQRREVVVVSVRFEDGDGDLGVDPIDLQGERGEELRRAYTNVPGWGIPANYEVTVLTQRTDGSWEERVFAEDNANFFPVLKPDGKPGPIKGILDMNIDNNYSNSTVMRKRRYKVRIIDRAFNISEQVVIPEGDEVTVPTPRD
ncbi:hypothetical protein DSL64_23120 [Dyadobacter luteus]|uniref:Lipoprotein n=1 Tax=Dyadobacter luteus TaxID=2259619 RepID=A0A3D8Y571_9BACT|nr:hypothetical protein [Dyadobacter luteus]REA57633.1 hypothetical protein DSL64_23120 [Dyadobacter luteus]